MQKRSLYAGSALVLLAALAWAYYHFHLATFLAQNSVPPAESYAQQVADAEAANAAGLSQTAAQAASQAAAANFANTYRGPGFSFGYPDTLKVGSTDDPDTGATTILAQDAAQHIGIQVAVSPDPGAPITQDEILKDLPQTTPHGFTPVSLDGAPGLAFAATDPNFGDSLQVWLAHGGQLYQISTYATDGPLLSKILGTWKWAN